MLKKILDADFAGAAELRAQVPGLRVIRMCSCGCPTADFGNEAGFAPDGPQELLNVEGLFPKSVTDGPPQQVLLFTRGGSLFSMELVYFSEKPPVEFHDSADMVIIVRD